MRINGITFRGDPDDIVPKALVWATTVLGLNYIHEETALEFFIRLRTYEMIYGPIIRGHPANGFLTYAQVVKHIGLRTDATRFTEERFRSRIMSDINQRAMRAASEESSVRLKKRKKKGKGVKTTPVPITARGSDGR